MSQQRRRMTFHIFLCAFLVCLILILRCFSFNHENVLLASNSSRTDIRALYDPHGYFPWCQGKGPVVLGTCYQILGNRRYEREPPKPVHIMNILELLCPKRPTNDSRDLIDVIRAQHVLELDRSKPYRVIAMAIYGSASRYTYGILRNALSVFTNETFMGWKLRVYYDNSVPNQLLHLLQAMGVELFLVETREGSDNGADQAGMFWRFLVLSDGRVTRYIIRDADALLSLRDQHAVDEWMAMGPPFFFHTQRDHSAHRVPIMGGMWGSVGGFLVSESNELFETLPIDHMVQGRVGRGIDQKWLASIIWPVVRNYTLSHASYMCTQFQCAKTLSYPTQRKGRADFVGNVYQPENNFTGIGIKREAPMECRRNPDWIYG